MATNYNDEQLKTAESDKKQALTENEQLYGNMIKESDSYYQAQIDASKKWAEEQSRLQQQKTDFAIEQINQQKDQTTKDYKKEQSGAYVDWQKQSNQYGANAEIMAAQGLANTGYSESSQVNMYNTYQARVAAARELYNRAILNYDNAIKDAQLQNNSILAEIAYNSLQQQLELSLQGFQYKNQLLIEQTNKKLEIGNVYRNRYQDVLDQINTENVLAELDVPTEKAVQTPPSFSSYEQAAEYLRNQGVTKGDGGLMTKSEWASRKSRGSSSGAVLAPSYSQYLMDHVEWKLQNPD